MKKKEALSSGNERTISNPIMEENQQKNNTMSGEMKELLKKYAYRPTALPQLDSFRQYPAQFPAAGGSVHVVLGPPSSGKTSLALHLGMSAAAAGRYVFYAAWDWAAGYISLRAQGWGDMSNTGGRFLFSDVATLDDIVAAAAILPAQSFFILDYVQICPCGTIPAGYSAGVEGRVSYTCDQIQAAARTSKQIFLLLSAENRASLAPAAGTAAGTTTLHSGYGSSRLEYAPDSVISVRWGGENMLRLTALKNRWGSTAVPAQEVQYQLMPLTPICPSEAPLFSPRPVPEPEGVYADYVGGGVEF